MCSYDVTAVRRSAFSRVRQKVLVRPSAVFELGIHHVSRCLYSLPAAAAAAAARRDSEASRVVHVDPEVGFVHHYRDCSNDYEYELDCDAASFVADARLVDAGYIPALSRNVRSTLDAALRMRRHPPSSAVEHPAAGT